MRFNFKLLVMNHHGDSVVSVKEKSVQINLHSGYYGTIAEIGGGQETARHLFQAGGASNSIAKTISAYDKKYSDHFYNNGQQARYVAGERVEKMLDYEYQELISILDGVQPKRFFAFANTVETLNYAKTNQGNGWLGVAWQLSERCAPNRMMIHVKLHENDTLLQQYSLGSLGINLIHAALFQGSDPRVMIRSLLHNLDVQRVEVDYVWVDGPDLQWCDNRLLNLQLVSNGMTPAIMFDKQGKVQQPGDMLYKKNVLLMRGQFRPVNSLAMEFFNDSLAIFQRDEDYKPDNTLALCEISLKNLMQGETLDEKDFLNRVDLLNLMGQHVMVSNFYRYFKLVDYFAQFKIIKLRIVVGLPTFDKIFQSSQYTDLRGGLLEAMGTLFQENVKLYLYPYTDTTTGQIVYPTDEHFEGEYRLLWQYLNKTRKILMLEGIPTHLLQATSAYITELITKADPALADYLPQKVYESICENKLFGYNTQA